MFTAILLAVATALVIVWRVWGPMMKILKSWYEAMEARSKALLAEEELEIAKIRHSRDARDWGKMQREEKIEEYIRQIEKAERIASQGKNKPVFFERVAVGEGEDPELVQEAFERHKKNRQQGNLITRFKPPWQ